MLKYRYVQQTLLFYSKHHGKQNKTTQMRSFCQKQQHVHPFWACPPVLKAATRTPARAHTFPLQLTGQSRHNMNPASPTCCFCHPYFLTKDSQSHHICTHDPLTSEMSTLPHCTYFSPTFHLALEHISWVFARLYRNTFSFQRGYFSKNLKLCKTKTKLHFLVMIKQR